MANWGTILKIDHHKAVVMTDDCKFVNLEKRDDMVIGQEVSFDENDLYKVNYEWFKYWPVASVCAAALILFLLLSTVLRPGSSEYAYVDLDINPSVHFVLNDEKEIIKIQAINDDGETVTQDLNLSGMKFEDAMETYIKKAMELGYLKSDGNGKILITFTLKGDKKEEETAFETYMSKIDILNDNAGYTFQIVNVSNDVREEASENGVSMARQQAYEDAVEKGEEISIDDVKDLSVDELEKILETDELEVADNDITEEPEVTDATDTEVTPDSNATMDPQTQQPEETIGNDQDSQATEDGNSDAGSGHSDVDIGNETSTPDTSDDSSQDDEYTKPEVSVSSTTLGVIIRWNKITSSHFYGYKVVISEDDSTPKYPENGYLYWITDPETTTMKANNRDCYNGGDFGGYLVPGKSYYFSVTAVYDDRKVAGNVVRVEYNGPKKETECESDDSECNEETNDDTQECVKPSVSATSDSDGFHISWKKITSSNLDGYKVVISKNDSTPKYSENGYLYWITDASQTTATADNSSCYNGGDFGGYLEQGERYYISVTALYDDHSTKIAGNVVRLEYKGPQSSAQEEEELLDELADQDLNVSLSMVNGYIRVNWNELESDQFLYYKVVISKEDSSPAYPEDGYLEYICDSNITHFDITSGWYDGYNGGDFGGTLESGETYYFSITAVYDGADGDRLFVKGNAVEYQVP